MMKSACEGALSLTGADGAAVELLDGAAIVCGGAAGLATPHLGLRLEASETLTGECFRTRRTIICGDSETDTRAHRAACRLVGARALILVPILHGGEMNGVLLVYSSTAHDFRGNEASLLVLLANTSTGIAVWDGDESATALLARADADMYTRKRFAGTAAR